MGINPVRKSPTFQPEGSHGALNLVFAPKGILSSSPLQAPIEAELRTGQAAGLSNGVKIKGEEFISSPSAHSISDICIFAPERISILHLRANLYPSYP